MLLKCYWFYEAFYKYLGRIIDLYTNCTSELLLYLSKVSNKHLGFCILFSGKLLRGSELFLKLTQSTLKWNVLQCHIKCYIKTFKFWIQHCTLRIWLVKFVYEYAQRVMTVCTIITEPKILLFLKFIVI